jgi:hypothetical protein
MTHEELDARLAKREMGPIGRVFLDRAINDELPDDKLASVGCVPRTSSI